MKKKNPSVAEVAEIEKLVSEIASALVAKMIGGKKMEAKDAKVGTRKDKGGGTQ